MRITITLALALSLVACHAPIEPKQEDGPSCEDKDADATFLTYNVAEGWSMVPYVGIRTPLIVEALSTARYDVACLQEAWHDDIRDAILGGLALPPEQSFVADTVDLGETGEDICDAQDLGPLRACAEAKCSRLQEPRETGICVRKECSKDVLELFNKKKTSCLRCLGAMAGHPTADVFKACTGDGASRIHGGRNGIMLLSRSSRLYNKEILPLPASSANKVALLATVRVPSSPGGEMISVEVACTHVSASNAIPPSHSGYKTWDEEKIAQIEKITARLTERSKEHGDASMVFLGDLNSGPEGKYGVTASGAEVWNAVASAGFEDPATGENGTKCSACKENTLGGGDGAHILDHVTFKNAKDAPTKLAEVCSDRMFDKTKTVTGYDGKEFQTDLSDHYGIRVLLDVSKK